jgi:hypothetical protein
MTEHDLKPGAVIEFSILDRPVELKLAVQRRDGSWFLVLAGNSTQVVSDKAVQNARLLKSAKPLIPVVSNGFLTVPLYHGTNDIWLQSIRDKGLGGRDVIAEFRVIELLKELLAIADAHNLEEPPGWSRHSAENIVMQRVYETGWNYRHGSTYLTASPSKAAQYVFYKRCGSEAIEYCLSWHEMIRMKRPDLHEALEEKFTYLLSATANVGNPLVLEVRSIPVQMLRNEFGGDVSQTLNELSELVTWHPDQLNGLGQSIIMEATGAISPSCVTAFKIGPDFAPGREEVNLIPL